MNSLWERHFKRKFWYVMICNFRVHRFFSKKNEIFPKILFVNFETIYYTFLTLKYTNYSFSNQFQLFRPNSTQFPINALDWRLQTCKNKDERTIDLNRFQFSVWSRFVQCKIHFSQRSFLSSRDDHKCFLFCIFLFRR